MKPFTFAIFIVSIASSLFIAQASAKQCVDAKDANPDKNPILKQRFPTEALDQLAHYFDSKMAAGPFLALKAAFSFNEIPLYHFEIKATNFATPGPYVIVSTFADGSEQWRYLQGEDNCDGSFQSLPTKVELAIIDFDKMKAQGKKDSQHCIYIPIDQVPTLKNHYPIAKQNPNSKVFDSQVTAINAHVTGDFTDSKLFHLKIDAPEVANPPRYVIIVGDSSGNKEHIWLQSTQGCNGKYRIDLPATLELATIKDTSVKEKADTPPKTTVTGPDAKRIASRQCSYADGLAVNQKPIVKQQYPITKKAGVTNTWDGGVLEIKNRITFDASKGSTFTLASIISEYATPGPYLVIVTTSTTKKQIWIKGGDGCHGQDLGGVPTKVELATLDFDAMKKRDARLAQGCALAQPPVGPRPVLKSRYPIAGSGKYDAQVSELNVHVNGQMSASLDKIQLYIDAPKDSKSTTYVIVMKNPKNRSEKLYYLKSNDGCNGIYWGTVAPTLELATIDDSGSSKQKQTMAKKPVATKVGGSQQTTCKPVTQADLVSHTLGKPEMLAKQSDSYWTITSPSKAESWSLDTRLGTVQLSQTSTLAPFQQYFFEVTTSSMVSQYWLNRKESCTLSIAINTGDINNVKAYPVTIK